eukprot:scaffold34989_cov118-Isochrysis_galbana.AAC.4
MLNVLSGAPREDANTHDRRDARNASASRRVARAAGSAQRQVDSHKHPRPPRVPQRTPHSMCNRFRTRPRAALGGWRTFCSSEQMEAAAAQLPRHRQLASSLALSSASTPPPPCASPYACIVPDSYLRL